LRLGRTATLVAAATVALAFATGCTDDGADDAASPRSTRGEDVAAPTVTGPIEGGTYDLPFNPAPRGSLEANDYSEEEYFLAGTATSYLPAEPWGEDGDWTVEEAETADYTTRVLVRRPVDPEEFDGTVVVEWLNVTAGMDADPGWGFASEELMRRGAAWVGVSAQLIGVEGGESIIDIPGLELLALKPWDPERYGQLSHPGDEYSFDIFSQAAQALLRPDGVEPLDGLDATQLIATGQSQSAARLVTYVNAVHPVADIYDGFMIHSRGDGGAPIDPAAAQPMPEPALIRTDLSDPVMTFQTETDLLSLGSLAARQPDTDTVVTWEVAGTAHADLDTVEYGIESGSQWNTTETPDFAEMCGGPLNDGGAQYPFRQALASLISWALGGEPPATGVPIETVAEPDGAVEIARDEFGNALGGVRTTRVDVPVATYDGAPRPDSSVVCSFFGSTTPFTQEQLDSLYASHDDYVRDVEDAADALLAEEFLLAPDRDALVEAAESAPVP